MAECLQLSDSSEKAKSSGDSCVLSGSNLVEVEGSKPSLDTGKELSSPAVDQPNQLTQQRSTDRMERPTDGNSVLPALELSEPGVSTEHTIKVDGQDATFRLHVPTKKCTPDEKLPLVVVFHGYGNHAGQGTTESGSRGMEDFSQYSELADRENFIVAYPTGDPKDHLSFNNKQWWFTKRDDIKITDQIITQLSNSLPVDPNRVYLVGYSQGGSFVHRAASELSHKPAAIAEVGGWMTGKEKSPSTPMPILSIHSDGDTHAPIESPGRVWWLTMKPHEYVTNFYRQANATTGNASRVAWTGLNGTTVTAETFENPATKAQVKTIYLQKEPHLWYGGKGAAGSAVNATEMTWQFLKQFKRENSSTQPTSR